MSRVFDALRKSQQQGDDNPVMPLETGFNATEKADGLKSVPTARVHLHPDSRIVVYESSGPGAERFRLLRMYLQELQAGGKLKTLLLTSPLPKDGKSTIALNLSTALARQGKRSVLLVEADLRQPVLLHRLGLKPWPGLADCLRCGSDPQSAIRRTEPLGFYLLPAGQPVSNAAELLQSERFSQFMQNLSACFDWVLIDSAPVTPVPDTLALKGQADACLLVVRAGYTPREAVEETIQHFAPGYVIGVILNAAERVERLYSRYSQYYQHQPENGSEEK